jgi:hypothetical protein
MKPIAAPTIAVLALLLAVTSITTARSIHKVSARCPPAHAHVLIADEQAQIYGNYPGDIYGCAYGHFLQDLGPTPIYSSQGSEGIELLKLAGTIVAYTERAKQEAAGERSAQFLIIVRNLRTGKT